jgi:alpha-L-fucosidase 2
VLHLLPALPNQWQNGSVKGLCARGGFKVDMLWREGQLSMVTICGERGGACTVRYKGREVPVKIKKGGNIKLDGNLVARKGDF